MRTRRLVTVSIITLLGVTLISRPASAVILAMDSASDPAYAAEAEGAWKGEYPSGDQYEQNPPGNDNGGFGFGTWSFSGGYYLARPPYGMVNHFIDGVDFPTTAFNNLGSPAFGLGNANIDGASAFMTSVASRPFDEPLAVGDVFSAEIDTPAEYDDFSGMGFPFAIIGFRDADGNEAFNIEAGSSVPFGDFPWRYDDLNHTNADFGVDAGGSSIAPTATSDGSSFSLEILSPTTGLFTFDGHSLEITFGRIVDGLPAPSGLPASVFFTLFDNNAVPISEENPNPTGEHAFYFDNLQIERPDAGVPGDYNGNGRVDAADYVLWRDGGPLENEVDTPGTVNMADYNEWRARFGNPVTGSGTAVPEPAGGLLALAGLGLLWVVSARHAAR